MAFLLGVLSFLFLGMVLTRLFFGPLSEDAVPTVPRVALGVLCYQLGTLICAGWFLRQHQTGWRVGFGWGNIGAPVLWLPLVTIALFLPVGALLRGGIALLLKSVGWSDQEQSALLILQNANTLPALLPLGFIVVILAPLVEEIVFRGVLYPWIKNLGFPRLALWSTAILFGVIHWNLAALLPLVGLALLFVWLYEKTDNLLAPILAHTLFNAVNFTLFLVLRERTP